MRVDPLDLKATRRLVRGLLDVDEELCDFLAARALGNPLFVTHLIQQLVVAEAVERRDGRYRLARAFDLSTVPADIRAVWSRRIDQSGASAADLATLALVRERVSLNVAEELASLGRYPLARRRPREGAERSHRSRGRSGATAPATDGLAPRAPERRIGRERARLDRRSHAP